MHGKTKFFLLLFISAAILFAALAIFRKHLFILMAKGLINEQPVSKCEALIILAGEFPDRAIAAADLYNQGYVKTIILPFETLSSGEKELKIRNLPFQGSNEQIPNLLLAMGVAKDDLIKTQNPTDRTVEEAFEAKRILEQRKDIKCLSIMTSRFHSQRAHIIFKRTLGNGAIEIKSFTPPFDDFKEDDWWKKPRYVRNVINEYLKLLLVPLGDYRKK